MQHASRYDANYELCKKGKNFVAGQSIFQDLNHVRILSSTVDTVRQVYHCTVSQEFENEISEKREHSPNHVLVHVHGCDFLVSGGGASGYKYRLQNNELGLIVFVKSRTVKPNDVGSHIKIEVSPKMLLHYSFIDIQKLMDGIAFSLSPVHPSHSGVSVHLALDVQGWRPDADFLPRLSCRSRRIDRHDGYDSTIISLGQVAVTYGSFETITVGAVNGVQMCVYDKSKEMHKSDKSDLMRDLWTGKFHPLWTPQEAYNEEQDVTRIELRFHQSVLKQLERGSEDCSDESLKIKMRCYSDVMDHLGALWNYGLELFQLRHNTKYIDPVWTMFQQDAEFQYSFKSINYRRDYKTAGECIEKNLQLALGNMLTIFARNKITARHAIKLIQRSGIWKDLLKYNKTRGITRADFFFIIEEKLQERRMLRNTA